MKGGKDSVDDMKLITIDELCETLQVGRNCAYELLRSGQIKAFRIGHVWKIPLSNVKDFIYQMSEKQANVPSSSKTKVPNIKEE